MKQITKKAIEVFHQQRRSFLQRQMAHLIPVITSVSITDENDGYFVITTNPVSSKIVVTEDVYVSDSFVTREKTYNFVDLTAFITWVTNRYLL